MSFVDTLIVVVLMSTEIVIQSVIIVSLAIKMCDIGLKKFQVSIYLHTCNSHD